MIIEIPQYLNDSQRLEYIKILHKIESIASQKTGLYWTGFKDCLKYTEMILSGAIKKIRHETD